MTSTGARKKESIGNVQQEERAFHTLETQREPYSVTTGRGGRITARKTRRKRSVEKAAEHSKNSKFDLVKGLQTA